MHLRRTAKALGCLSDVALWLFLFLLLWGSWDLWQHVQPIQQTFHLRFDDASELSQGCQVRMMGREVGVVKGVRFEEDHISVDVMLDRGSLDVPLGALITIEFTGLAGSKSVEIFPPTFLPTQGKQLRLKHPSYPFQIKQPIRMQDVQTGQIIVADALKEGAENFAQLLGNGDNNLKHNQDAIVKLHRSLVAANTLLTDTKQEILNASQTLDNTLRGTTHSLNTFNHGLNALSRTKLPSGKLKESVTLVHETKEALLRTKTGFNRWFANNAGRDLLINKANRVSFKRRTENKAEKTITSLEKGIQRFCDITDKASKKLNHSPAKSL